MRILIDMDETVCDLMTPWIAWINKTYGRGITKKQIKRYDFAKQFHLPDSFRDFLFERTTFNNLREMPGAAKHINQLHAEGHEIIFLTHVVDGHRNIKNGKIKWLKSRFKWLNPMLDVVFVNESADKANYAGDILIDDHPGVLAAWEDNNPNGLSIAFSQPYNESFYYRVRSWNEFHEHVRALQYAVDDPTRVADYLNGLSEEKLISDEDIAKVKKIVEAVR